MCTKGRTLISIPDRQDIKCMFPLSLEVIYIIKLNNRDFPWEEGLTIEKIMKIKKFTFPKIIVKVNGMYIEKEDYATTIVNDGDNVEIIHLLAGG